MPANQALKKYKTQVLAELKTHPELQTLRSKILADPQLRKFGGLDKIFEAYADMAIFLSANATDPEKAKAIMRNAMESFWNIVAPKASETERAALETLLNNQPRQTYQWSAGAASMPLLSGSNDSLLNIISFQEGFNIGYTTGQAPDLATTFFNPAMARGEIYGMIAHDEILCLMQCCRLMQECCRADCGTVSQGCGEGTQYILGGISTVVTGIGYGISKAVQAFERLPNASSDVRTGLGVLYGLAMLGLVAKPIINTAQLAPIHPYWAATRFVSSIAIAATVAYFANHALGPHDAAILGTAAFVLSFIFEPKVAKLAGLDAKPSAPVFSQVESLLKFYPLPYVYEAYMKLSSEPGHARENAETFFNTWERKIEELHPDSATNSDTDAAALVAKTDRNHADTGAAKDPQLAGLLREVEALQAKLASTQPQGNGYRPALGV